MFKALFATFSFPVSFFVALLAAAGGHQFNDVRTLMYNTPWGWSRRSVCQPCTLLPNNIFSGHMSDMRQQTYLGDRDAPKRGDDDLVDPLASTDDGVRSQT